MWHRSEDAFSRVRVSPDKMNIALSIYDPETGSCKASAIYNVATGKLQEMEPGYFTVWSPSGRYVFHSNYLKGYTRTKEIVYQLYDITTDQFIQLANDSNFASHLYFPVFNSTETHVAFVTIPYTRPEYPYFYRANAVLVNIQTGMRRTRREIATLTPRSSDTQRIKEFRFSDNDQYLAWKVCSYGCRVVESWGKLSANF